MCNQFVENAARTQSNCSSTVEHKMLSVGAVDKLRKWHSKYLSRTYPSGTRVNSSNYDPVALWNVGAQMVALNYQSNDRQMTLNSGLFAHFNGGCGYVLKPKHIRDATEPPSENGCQVTVRLLSGYRLPCDNPTVVFRITQPKLVRAQDWDAATPKGMHSLHALKRSGKYITTTTGKFHATSGFTPSFTELRTTHGCEIECSVRDKELAIFSVEVSSIYIKDL